MDQLDDANALEMRLVMKAEKDRVPITASFELTPACNLRCDMCFIRMGMAEAERLGGLRRTDHWMRVAEGLQRMGTLFILLTGGEPLSHPDFKEIYTRLRRMGFVLTVNTNGTLIDEDTAQLFATLKPRRINVTLYGGGNDTYHRLCHSADGFDRCANGLRLLKKYKVDTKMNVSVVKGNRDDYERILALSRQLDIPAEVNSYMFPVSRRASVDPHEVVAQRLDAEAAAAAEIDYMKYREEAAFPQYAAYVNDTLARDTTRPKLCLECRAATSSCWINWMGRMTPCVMLENPSVPLDSVTVEEAWGRIVREGARLTPHDECEGCALHTVCNVCYAAACHEKAVTGSLDYLCRMAAAKKSIWESCVSPSVR